MLEMVLHKYKMRNHFCGRFGFVLRAVDISKEIKSRKVTMRDNMRMKRFPFHCGF